MDEYYEKLPFTFDKEQYQQEFLILGTGLLQCLLAAYYTKVQQRKGIVIDTEKTYGSMMKTLSLREFHETMTMNTITSSNNQLQLHIITEEKDQKDNDQWYQEKKANNKFRGYNIDIQPKFFYGSSVTCDMLKDADMDKYMDFRVITTILFLHSGKLQYVPLSKGTIFESKALSLFEKKQLLKTLHSLFKIHNLHKKVQSDVNSTNEFDKDQSVDEVLYDEFIKTQKQFCLPFLRKICNNNEKIIRMLAYVILNYCYEITDPIPAHVASQYTVEGMIDKFGRFVKSCGVYGETPYLYVDNGIGDIPQAFSRIASIFGTTFILHPKVEIQDIQQQEGSYKIKTNLCPDGELSVKQLLMGLPFVNMCKQKLKQQVHQTREQVLKVILLCHKNQMLEDYSYPAICHLYDLKEPLLQNPINMFIFDNSSSSCPQQQVILSLETIVPNKTPLNEAADILIGIAQRLFNSTNQQGFILYKAKFSQINSYYEGNKQILQGGNWSIDLDGIFQAFKDRVNPTTIYFKTEANKIQQEQEEEPDYYVNLVEKLQTAKIQAEAKKILEEVPKQFIQPDIQKIVEPSPVQTVTVEQDHAQHSISISQDAKQEVEESGHVHEL